MRDRGVLVFIAASAAVAAFSLLAVIVCVIREGFSANGASWAQAAGSIAAVAGAVWLFRKEARVRRREQRAIGEEVAWAVRFALINAEHEAKTIAAELAYLDPAKGENPGKHWLLQSENCQNVLKVLAGRTDHIHPALNQFASNGMLLLRQMDEDIGRAVSFIKRGERPAIDITTDIARYQGLFALLIGELDARMRGIRKTLNENGDVFPLSDFEAWNMSKS